MKFTPKSEKEIAEMNLLSKGEYSFQVASCEETVSKKGAPMLVLTLYLYDHALQPCGRVRDYLLEAMPHKLRHAAYACGLGEKYESGNLDASDFNGRNGSAKIGIEQDKTGQYPDKNVVLDYVRTQQDGSPKLQEKEHKYVTEDDIPF